MYYCVICNRELLPKVKTEVARGVVVHAHCLVHLKETYGGYWDAMLRSLLATRKPL